MKNTTYSNLARTAAVVLALMVTVGWVSAIGAAPKCYPRRYQPQTGGVLYDAATGLTWQQTLDPMSYNWNDAKAHCSGLSGAWRLPSLTELQTIVDDTRQFPSIDPTAFPGTPNEYFWTSSPLAGNPSTAWSVNFNNGYANNVVVTNTYRVRCVR